MSNQGPYLASVDIGGTFTDCLLTWEEKFARGKSDTTPYNIGVGFMQALERAAESLGIPLEEVVPRLDTVKYSTTIPMNSLIQRTGPRIGVIITQGFEDTLAIGRTRQWGDGLSFDEIRNLARVSNPMPVVPRDLVVGVQERINLHGEVIIPLSKEELVEKLRYLMEKKVRGIAVCLIWSFVNPAHERLVYDSIREVYPEAFLGNMPVLLSSEIAPVRGEYLRLNSTVLNTYIQVEIKDQIHTMGTELKEKGYKKSIFLVHNTGGLGKFTRTPAVNIYGSGPVSGVHGVSYLSKLYGDINAIATDMGGTSFDFGVLPRGEVRHYFVFPIIDRFRVALPMIEVSSIGAGGGSIAWFHPTLGRLMIGPQSAGAMPGPACYNMGGTQATVTDADVVLGYLNPDYFLGGIRKLTKELAEKAIKENIAEPMGLSLIDAAWSVKEVIDSKMADVIFAETGLKGYDPTEYTLFAYGGAGPTHCWGYGSRVGVPRIITMPQSSVFSAFGATTMPGMHVYDYSKFVTLQKFMSPELLKDYESFNETVRILRNKAIRDLTREGYKEEELQFLLELEMKWGGTQVYTTTVKSPRLSVYSDEDVNAVIDAFEEEYAAMFGASAVFRLAGSEALTFRLKAFAPPIEIRLPVFEPVGESPEQALKGRRPVYWREKGDFVDTPIHEYELLQCGNLIRGPAVVEAPDTTVVLPPGTRMTVDKYLQGIIEKD